MRKIRPRSGWGLKRLLVTDHGLNHCIRGSVIMAKMIILVTLYHDFYCQWIEEENWLYFWHHLSKSSRIYIQNSTWQLLSIDHLLFIWPLFIKETKFAVLDNGLLISSPASVPIWVYMLWVLVFCCAYYYFFSFNRFLILQSDMQDWLLQCTHIARLTGYMCPDMAHLQRRHMEKVHPFGTVNQFILSWTLQYFCLCKLPQ